MYAGEKRAACRADHARVSNVSQLTLGYGRFLQADPIGYEDGLNLYGYAGGDPVNKVDPSGMAQIISYCTGGYTSQIGDEIRVLATVCSYTDGGGGGYRKEFLGETPCHPTGRGGVRKCTDEAAAQEGPEVVVTSDCNMTCVANMREQERIKWVFFNDRYMLNPFYERPWYDIGLDGIFAVELGAAAVAGSIVAAPEIAVEGAAKGYSLYGRGRLGQIRFNDKQLIIRVDVKKPITHLNVEGNIFGRSFNFHFPRW